MSTYCDTAPGHPLHGPYHDDEYGVPQRDDAVLCERLVMEIMQAGLSWELILRRRPLMRIAFEGYGLDVLAGIEVESLDDWLVRDGLIRNRRKLLAVGENARRLRVLCQQATGFAGWLDTHHPRTHKDWVKLFRHNFVFMGPEIVGEFLMSLGYLPGAHRETCPVGQAQAANHALPWRQAGHDGFDYAASS